MDAVGPLRDLGEVALRLGSAAVIGGVLGLNRQLHDKPAGLRTHALVAVGSALAMLLSIEVTESGEIADMGSMTRVVQGVLTGIGFLGAGVIFRQEGGKVKGLTTAAEIWVVACLGMACGAGRWHTALIATALTFAVLVGGSPIERIAERLLRKEDFGGVSRRGAEEETRRRGAE